MTRWCDAVAAPVELGLGRGRTLRVHPLTLRCLGQLERGLGVALHEDEALAALRSSEALRALATLSVRDGQDDLLRRRWRHEGFLQRLEAALVAANGLSEVAAALPCPAAATLARAWPRLLTEPGRTLTQALLALGGTLVVCDSPQEAWASLSRAVTPADLALRLQMRWRGVLMRAGAEPAPGAAASGEAGRAAAEGCGSEAWLAALRGVEQALVRLAGRGVPAVLG